MVRIGGGLMTDAPSILERVEVSDGELHKLKQDIFYALFAFKLVIDVDPILTLTSPHEIQ